MIDDLIESGQYVQALELLNDMSDEQSRYQRLLCLNGLERYQEAKKEAVIAKELATDTYYDVVALYLNVLKELEEYEEAVNILVEELSMPYIPYQYDSLFNTVYDEILILKQEKNASLNVKSTIFSAEEVGILLDQTECNNDLLYMALEQLEQLNIRMIMGPVKRFLLNPKKHPFAKSLIMEALIEQQVDEELTINKSGMIYNFNPIYLPYVLEQNAYQGIYHYLERELENDNPTLLAQCLEFLEYMLYYYFPREIYEDEYNVYAAAIHYYIASLQAIEVEEEDVLIAYSVYEGDLQNKILALQAIEC